MVVVPLHTKFHMSASNDPLIIASKFASYKMSHVCLPYFSDYTKIFTSPHLLKIYISSKYFYKIYQYPKVDGVSGECMSTITDAHTHDINVIRQSFIIWQLLGPTRVVILCILSSPSLDLSVGGFLRHGSSSHLLKYTT